MNLLSIRSWNVLARPDMSVRRRLYDRIRLNFALFPGIARPQSAWFLKRYYEHERASFGVARRLLNLLIYLGFRAWLPLRARKVARRWRKDKSWTRRALAICRERFVDPNDVALFRIETESELDHLMRRFEHIGVGRAIAFAATDHHPVLTDKRQFYDRCAAGGVPHPMVFATIDEGRAHVRAVPAGGEQLFIKPTCASGGEGAHVRDFDERGDDGAGAFRQFLLADPRLARGSWIVQRRLRAHPAVRAFSGRALPTARITTMLDERGGPEIVTTVLRLSACEQAVIDNIGIGGLSAPIDPLTGRIGSACGGMRPGEFPSHPITGARIEGRVVPQWETMKRLALETHARHFSDHVMIGWDVAVSDPSPCLLEANPRPSIIMAQRASRMPVGKTRMGALIAYHLDRRFREEARDGRYRG